jgi:hypothetical protein
VVADRRFFGMEMEEEEEPEAPKQVVADRRFFGMEVEEAEEVSFKIF